MRELKDWICSRCNTSLPQSSMDVEHRTRYHRGICKDCARELQQHTLKDYWNKQLYKKADH